MHFQISFRRESRSIDTWVIKVKVLRKVFNKQFCFISCRKQHLRAIKYRRYRRFTFVGNTISSPESYEPSFKEMRLFCFIRISKFGSFKSLFVMITSLSEIHLRCRGFMLLVQAKAMTYGSSKNS